MKNILLVTLLIVGLMSLGFVSAQCQGGVLLTESFENPLFIVSDPNHGQDYRESPGWVQVGGHPSYASILSENYVLTKKAPYPSYPVVPPYTLFSTPFGAQGVEIYSTTSLETTLNEVLEGDKKYELSFNVARRADQEKGAYLVELVAGNTVLAFADGNASQDDMSESETIVFTSNPNHPALGQTLKIRLKQNPNKKYFNHKPVYDNIQLKSECLCTPTEETCNGIDDDCNGIIDDVDVDGDGMNDCTEDDCLGSTADNIELNPNQYAQNINFGVFECGSNNDASVVYSMVETKGCTCTQIVEKLDAGEGHLKKGCSPSLMEEFTGLSSEADRQQHIGQRKGITGRVIDFFDSLI